MSAAGIRARADLGRLIMIPGAAILLTLDLIALRRGGRGGAADGLGWLATGLVCTFYLLIIWCYLRRGKAAATSGSRPARVAAVAATIMPFAFPLLGAAPPAAGTRLAADALLAAGTGWSVWALRSLGRNLSVFAQARGLAERGPYRWVRHPLYTGEIVSALGLALVAEHALSRCRLGGPVPAAGIPGGQGGAGAAAGAAGIPGLSQPHRGLAARPLLAGLPGFTASCGPRMVYAV